MGSLDIPVTHDHPPTGRGMLVIIDYGDWGRFEHSKWVVIDTDGLSYQNRSPPAKMTGTDRNR